MRFLIKMPFPRRGNPLQTLLCLSASSPAVSPADLKKDILMGWLVLTSLLLHRKSQMQHIERSVLLNLPDMKVAFDVADHAGSSGLSSQNLALGMSIGVCRAKRLQAGHSHHDSRGLELCLTPLTDSLGLRLRSCFSHWCPPLQMQQTDCYLLVLVPSCLYALSPYTTLILLPSPILKTNTLRNE